MNDIEERERLRLELETFLREEFRLGENFAAVPENWDARDWAMMTFRLGSAEVRCSTTRRAFDEWRGGYAR